MRLRDRSMGFIQQTPRSRVRTPKPNQYASRNQSLCRRCYFSSGAKPNRMAAWSERMLAIGLSYQTKLWVSLCQSMLKTPPMQESHTNLGEASEPRPSSTARAHLRPFVSNRSRLAKHIHALRSDQGREINRSTACPSVELPSASILVNLTFAPQDPPPSSSLSCLLSCAHPRVGLPRCTTRKLPDAGGEQCGAARQASKPTAQSQDAEEPHLAPPHEPLHRVGSPICRFFNSSSGKTKK
ncbi:hypothetical protein LY76DRAFT_203334 [Colletotrichum caudatum]|nr:hypothetical protein LY76DRAFT_203334 [Colletotrichum caudatum]